MARGRIAVEPVLPVDVLGAYVLLPVLSSVTGPAPSRAEPNRTDVARRRNSQEFQTIRSEESEKSNLADLWNLAPYR